MPGKNWCEISRPEGLRQIHQARPLFETLRTLVLMSTITATGALAKKAMPA